MSVVHKYAATAATITIAAAVASFGFKLRRRALLPIDVAGLERTGSGLPSDATRGVPGRADYVDVYGKSIDVHKRTD